jgi:putative transposase
LYGQIRKELQTAFHRLAHQKECRIESGFLMPDHVHMMVSIPPKHSVAQIVGFLKGKTAIHVARRFGNVRKNFIGQHFWARGYHVSTVGYDEAVIRRYIENQEEEDNRLDQQKNLFN